MEQEVSGRSTVSTLPSMEKLDGNSNYATWKFLMELYLLHDDLWEFTKMSPEETDAQAIRKDQRARAKICLMVKPHCLVHVRSAKTAKQAWEALRNAFEDRGLNNRCRLLSKLVSMKLEQFPTLREYVTSVMMVSQELQDLGKEVDDELLAALLLQGLTPEFQPVRLAIENSDIVLTTDYVKTKLFQMEDTYSASTSGNQSALFSNKNKNKGKSTPKKVKQSIKCFICGGPHKANVCPDNPKGKKEALQAYALGTDWIIDSGASTHMSNNKAWFRNLKDTSKALRVMCADGNEVLGAGEGTVVCETGLTINNVTYVPELASNLLSVNMIARKGHVIVFTENECKVFKKDECKVQGYAVVKGVSERGIYKIKGCLQDSALSTAESDQQMLWHRRMGHLGMHNLKLLRDKMATGVSFPNTSSKLECVSCVMGKQTKQPFQKSGATRAKEALGLVHSDVSGPMNVPSVSGFRYFLTFIDDFTRKTFIYFLKQKSEVFEKFKDFKALAENQCGQKIKILRTDNGTEFVNKQMDNYLKQCGIVHQLTVEYTPEQNGVAERANRTICEKARSMLHESGLAKRFWAEAVHHAVYLKNKSPTIAVKDMTPDEKWFGKKCDLSMVRTFGCKAFMHVPEQKRTKWDVKSRELIHTGFCDNSKAYRLVDPTTGEIFKARNVVFFESKKSECDNDRTVEETFPPTETVIELETTPETICDERVPDMSSTEQDRGPGTSTQEPASDRRYPLRERQKRWFPDCVTYEAIKENVHQDPITIQNALSRQDGAKWKVAIEEELEALKKNNTWTLVKPPRSCNIVDSKWLLRIKEEAGGKTRYKARLVARGFSQRRGVDYFETFSPVVRHSSLRILFALAARLKLKIDQMDVKTAFLNGDLDEVVYMKQPEGFEVKGKEDYVCLLNKSLYGLKQAPRTWNSKLHAELTKLNFQRSVNEPCVYKRIQNGNVIIIAVYVDDILIFWNNKQEMLSVKRDLKCSFEMKDLGKAELMLGIQIEQDQNGVKLHQERYVEKLLEKYNMTDCKPVVTPAVAGERLEKPTHGRKPDERIPYRPLIGSLMYLAVCTRPDIAHAVNYLSQFNECYEENHWIAAKRILRYLKGTKTLGLRYSKKSYENSIECFADADYAGDSDRRSYSGSVFLIQGGAVSWQSTKQRTVALSTAEAEYVSLSEAAKEAVFLRRFIGEMIGQEDEQAITIYSDSQSAIAIANNPVHHQRTKHVDIRYHFVRDAVESNVIRLKYRETERMVADALTKALPRGKFEWCVKGMGLCV